MNMVAVDIVGRDEHRRAPREPFARAALAIAGIDARCTQDAQAHASGARPGPQHPLGIDTPPRALGGRRDRTRFAHASAACIAIDAGRADVDEPTYDARTRKRLHKGARAAVLATLGRRRCQMQDGVGHGSEARQRCRLVQIADQRHDTGGAQCGTSRR